MRVVCDGCKRVLANKGSLKNHLKLVISNQKFRFSFQTKQLKLFILFRNSIVVYCIELLCILSEILVTLFHFVTNLENQGFRSENQDFFLADPDPDLDPGKKSSCGSGFWGYPGEGAGGKGKK